VTARRLGPVVVGLLSVVHSTSVAQYAQPRTQVELTAYGGVSLWKDQGTLLGGGLQFESAVTRWLSFYGDAGLAAVVGGCETLAGAACPSTSWHVLGGLRLYPLASSTMLRPYLGLATGRLHLGNSTSLFRAEGGVLIQTWRSVALQLGGHYSWSTIPAGPRLWGGLAGLRIRL
jgi:hypothetical protein